jgi:hypothetical protein
LRNGRRAGLCAGNELERGTDAQHSGSIQFVETTRGKELLARRAEGDEAEFGAFKILESLDDERSVRTRGKC